MEKVNRSIKQMLSMLMVMLLMLGLFPAYSGLAYADDEALRFTFNGSEYVVYKNDSQNGSEVSWTCDYNGSFKITFKTSGVFRLTGGSIDNATVTVIGGGGGGDSAYSGGGGDAGAGGELVTSYISIPQNTDFEVTVGNGGAGGWTSWTLAQRRSQTRGSDGGYSAFGSVVASGGAGGGGAYGASGTGAGGDGYNRSGGGGGSVDTFYETDVGNFGHGGFSCFICGENYMDPSVGDIYWYSGWTPLYQEADYPGYVDGGSGNDGGGAGGNPANDHGCSGPNVGYDAVRNTGSGGGGGAWGTWCYLIESGGMYTGAQGSREYAGYAGSGGSGASGIVYLEGEAESGPPTPPPSPTPTVEYSMIQLKKASSNPEISSGNSNYSLAGCRIDMYKTEEDAWNKTNAIASFISNENGDFICSETGEAEPWLIEVGDYWIRELVAPPGYAIYEPPELFSFPKGNLVTITFTDTPSSDPVPIILKKMDADILEEGITSGKMSLADAEYTLKFYGGLYDSAYAAEASGNLLRTWVIKTDSDGFASLTDSRLFVSGDSLYYAENGNVSLPLGTLVIQETKAPIGFLINNEKYVVKITEDGADQDVVRTYNAPIIPETAIKGGVKIRKLDEDSQSSVPQGDASIAGAQFTIFNASGKTIRVEGVDYEAGAAVKTIVADSQGIASTGSYDLPYGDYEIAETIAPDGYMLNETRFSFTINNNSSIIDVGELSNQVIRGGVSVQKLSADSGTNLPHNGLSLAGAKFEIINRSAKAVTVNGTVYQPNSVVTTITTDSDGHATTGNGVLPYGTYEIKEIEPPDGYTINEEWSQRVQIRDNVIYSTDEYGDSIQVVDEILQQEFPHASTLLLDETTQLHLAVADENVSLIDTVTYSNLKIGETYEISGKLLDQTNGTPIRINGEELTTSTGEFVAQDESGTAQLTYNINASSLEGRIVFSKVWLTHDGEIVFVEEDLNNKEQTLYFPKIQTQAKGRSGEKGFVAGPNTIIVDTITYDNLIPGMDYIMKGTLVDKSTGTIIRDTSGNEVAAETAFSPEHSSGTVDVVFEFDSSNFCGKSIVAFEQLTCNGKLVARHEDVNDVEQTVSFPKISTTLTDSNDNHILLANNSVNLTDLVEYEGLTAGTNYTLTGTLIDKETGAPITDSNGQIITSHKTFCPADGGIGTIEITFAINANELEGKCLVAYEEVSLGGQLVAEHKDINDEGQTVYIPSVRTTASGKNGDKEFYAQGTIEVVDIVEYKQLKVGERYTVNGVLMNKATNEPIQVNGNTVTDTKSFVAQSSDGTISLTFRVNAAELKGTTAVAFEEIVWNGFIVGEHKDIEDEGQTVRFPSISTTAKNDSGGNEILAGKEVVIVDTVRYSSLIPGTVYTLTGALMDKATGRIVRDANGEEVKASMEFTPNTESGTIDLRFTGFDLSNLESKTLVVYEQLFKLSNMIARHEDINDISQTVYSPKIRTSLVSEEGTHNIPGIESVTVKDTVIFENLKPGKSYSVTGILMDKSTGLEAKDETGASITSSTSFIAEEASGTVELEFTFDAREFAGNALVAYEELSNEFGVIAEHKDLTDEDQTVYVPRIGTNAYSGATGEKEILASSNTVIIDTVAYESLIAGQEYTLVGTLMDKATGEVVKGVNGEPIAGCTVTKKFVATAKDGSEIIQFTIDAREIAGATLVVFEELLQNDDHVAEHKNIDDVAQTIYVPKIRTLAHSEEGSKEFLADGIIKIVDTVMYENLTPGKTYTIKGTLMDKSTGKVLKDKHGDVVTAETTFVPAERNGSADVTFEFDASELRNKSLVAFENLHNEISMISSHEDLNDDDQTVRLPEVRTTLKAENGKQIIPTSDTATITDTVSFKNLCVGKTYTVSGSLYNKATGALILDADNHPITAQTEFEAKTVNGTVDLVFSFNSNLLAGTTIVAFEELSNEFGVIATHKDLSDENQTGYIPQIHTTFADADGNKVFLADGTVTIIDTVAYTNLKVGETYTVTGVLMDKTTGETLKDSDGKTISVSKTFTVKKESSGSVDVVFRISKAENLVGRTFVAFEKLFYEGNEITSHEDLDDQDQTIAFPKIHTSATDRFGAHVTGIGTQTLIKDRVDYQNLVIGETYTMTGVLMDKSTGKPLKDADGDKIETTLEFIPSKSDGFVEIEFVLDTLKLENNSLVAFEQLTHAGRVVAKHEDLKDEEQSVYFPKIGTTAKFEKKTVLEAVGVGVETVSIIDTVAYNNLIPGLTYKVSGTIMNKKDGSPLRNENGEAYVVEREFSPEKTSGTVDVRFEIPLKSIQGKTVVAFESLMLGANTIAVHRDINDSDQTLEVPYLSRGFKYDATDSRGLAGAVFRVTDKGLTDSAQRVSLLEPQTVISDEKGYFYFATLPGHQYSITEMEAPDGYIRDKSEFIVDVSLDGVLSGDTEISNVHGGTIVISKTDVVTGVPLAGCEITIFKIVIDEEATAAKAAKENKPVSKVEPVKKRVKVFTQSTDEKGRVYFYTDTFGSFVYKETRACDGYYLNDEEYSFTINEDLSVTGETHITNIPFGTVVMKKVNTEGKPLAGAQIAFYNEYNRYLGQGVSDAKGRVYFVSPGPGKYYFTEVKAPSGYQRITDHYHFQIANDYSITGTLTLVNGRNENTGGGLDTGDSQNLLLWIAAASFSTALAATAIFFAFKNKKRLGDKPKS